MNQNNQQSFCVRGPQALLSLICLIALIFILQSCGKDKLSEIPPAIHASYLIVDFGDVAIGGAGVIETLPLTNVGGQVLDVSAAITTDGAAVGFSYVAPEAAIALKSLEIYDLELKFLPVQQGSVETTLLLSTNDPLQAALEIKLIGNGISANLCASPGETLDFGEVQQGAELVRSIVLENCGSAQLCISNVDLGEESAESFSLFEPPNAEICLLPGESITLNVVFKPGAAESYTGTLDIESNNNDGNVSVSLMGSGAPPPVCLTFNPATLAFGGLDNPVYVGGSPNLSTTASNCGTDPVRLTFHQITGPEASAFSVNSVQELPYDLDVADTAEGQSAIDFNVIFSPPDSGLFTATLEVYHCHECDTEEEEQVVIGSVLLEGYAASLCEPTPECCGPDCITEWEIVRNGDFSETESVTANWSNCTGVVQYPTQWNVRVDEPYNNDEPLACSGEAGGIDHHWIEVVDSGTDEYGNVLKVKKDKGGGAGSWDIVTQTHNLDVSKCGSLVFSLDGKAIDQSLRGAGHTQGEWPVIMRIAYEDANGVDHKRFHEPGVYGWQHGLYYLETPNGDPGYLSEPQIPAAPLSTLVTQDTWYSEDTSNNPNSGQPFDSGNLMELLDPPPKIIYWIGVGGAGWDYTSEIDNVSLIGSQPPCN